MQYYVVCMSCTSPAGPRFIVVPRVAIACIHVRALLEQRPSSQHALSCLDQPCGTRAYAHPSGDTHARRCAVEVASMCTIIHACVTHATLQALHNACAHDEDDNASKTFTICMHAMTCKCMMSLKFLITLEHARCQCHSPPHRHDFITLPVTVITCIKHACT